MIKKSILLVEYDESTIKLIKDICPDHLFDITLAHDGETAKRILAGRRFDLMITAAMLPRFHGFNLSLAAATEQPGIKIIIISGIYKGVDYRHQALTQYRADDFIEKPLDREKLQQKVIDLLGLTAKDLELPTDASTNIPIFGSAAPKPPPPPRAAPTPGQENQQLSSEDIFADIIDRVERIPDTEFELDGGTEAKLKKSRGEKVVKPASAEIPFPDVMPHGDSGKEKKAALKRDRDMKREGEILDLKLDDLLKVKARQIPVDKLKKIEDDIAKKLEDTLSGLGIHPNAPSKAPAPMKEQAPAPSREPFQPKAPVMEPTPAPEKPRHEEKPKKVPSVSKPAPEPPLTPAPVVDSAPPLVLEEALFPEQIPAVKKDESVVEMRPEEQVTIDMPPSEVGDYVILGLIARGGMAEIYKAKKKGVKGFEKIIAIKRILSGYGEDDKFIEMLCDEAKIAAELSHPNIVQIYDFGIKDNYYFIAMEYVLGRDLREIQKKLIEKEKILPEELSLMLVIKVLEALNYAHQAKDGSGRRLEIVHRDVSPPNIMISYHGDVKLTDFGVSKTAIKVHQTLSGALKGKLLYMSPEQARGDASIDYRSDLYTVGVVLFELITGRKLFIDHTEMGVLKKVQNGEIIPPSQFKRGIDPELERIILKSLQKDRDKRYQSAAEMITDLETFVRKRFDYIPGPIHLAHFIYGLFEDEIVKEGIKIDLKPIPETVRRPVPAKDEKPTPSGPAKPEKPIEISFEDEGPAPGEPIPAKPVRPEPAPKAAVEPEFPDLSKIEPLFHEYVSPKKRRPRLVFVLLLIMALIAAGVYFLIMRKSPLGRPAVKSTQKPAAEQIQLMPETEPSSIPPGAAEQAVTGTVTLDQTAEPLMDPATADQRKSAPVEEKIQDKNRPEEGSSVTVKPRLEKPKPSESKAEEAPKTGETNLPESNLPPPGEAVTADNPPPAETRPVEPEVKREFPAPAPVREGDVLPFSEVDMAPVPVYTPFPTVSEDVRRLLTDTQNLMVSLLIDQTGKIESLRLIKRSNIGRLNSLLLEVFKTWRYKPAIKNNVRVKVWKTIPVRINK